MTRKHTPVLWKPYSQGKPDVVALIPLPLASLSGNVPAHLSVLLRNKSWEIPPPQLFTALIPFLPLVSLRDVLLRRPTEVCWGPSPSPTGRNLHLISRTFAVFLADQLDRSVGDVATPLSGPSVISWADEVDQEFPEGYVPADEYRLCQWFLGPGCFCGIPCSPPTLCIEFPQIRLHGAYAIPQRAPLHRPPLVPNNTKTE